MALCHFSVGELNIDCLDVSNEKDLAGVQVIIHNNIAKALKINDKVKDISLFHRWGDKNGSKISVACDLPQWNTNVKSGSLNQLV